MPKDADAGFYQRADAHISLSNDQLKDAGIGNVSASMMYGLARFNACLSASKFQVAKEMAAARQEAIEYFTKQYRLMLEEHLDDYIANFDKYRELSSR